MGSLDWQKEYPITIEIALNEEDFDHGKQIGIVCVKSIPVKGDYLSIKGKTYLVRYVVHEILTRRLTASPDFFPAAMPRMNSPCSYVIVRELESNEVPA